MRTTRYVNGGESTGVQFLRDAACVIPGHSAESRRRRRSRVATRPRRRHRSRHPPDPS